MEIWVLFFWSAKVSIFEGGQYRTKLGCEEAALVQLVQYEEHGYDDLEHICEIHGR